MKRFHLLIIVSLIAACLFCGVACSVPQLDKPTGLKVDKTTLLLTWNKVADARYYSVKVEGAETKTYRTSKNSYSLTQVSEGNYNVYVQACGKEGELENSEWSEPIPFYREKETGMAFKLINNDTEYEVASKGNSKSADGHFVIPDTYRDKPVTSIGSKAFFNQSELVTLTLGKNIKNIAKQAFANCSYLEKINNLDGVVTIGERAFQSCRKLSGEVVIPDSVTELGEKAFQNCRSVTGFKIGAGLKVIPGDAFSNCDVLESIVISDSVEEIGDYAFANSDAATTLTIGKNVKTIGDYAFAHSPLIETAVIPESVTDIGEGAFEACSALKNVTLGNAVQTIGQNAFKDAGVWTDCETNDVYVGNWYVGAKDNTVKTVEFKDGTVGIASYALYKFEKLAKVVLPNSVKTVNYRAFALSGITSVILGSGVETIGEQAFAACSNLTQVILSAYDSETATRLDSSLKTIENYAFENSAALKGITIPQSVTYIGTRAFRGTGIWNSATDGIVYAGNWVVDCNDEYASAEMAIKDGTVGIASYAFYNGSVITKLTVADSVKYICRAAFYKAMALEEIKLPAELERIEDYTFYRCESLTGITLPHSLKHIGRSAFYKCSLGNLITDTDYDTLVIPDRVETIGDYAFYNIGYTYEDDLAGTTVVCGIDKIIIGNGVTSIGEKAFYSIPSLTSVEFGNNVKTVGARAFYKCPRLMEVDFGNSLEVISERAFFGCDALKSVDLPETVHTVGNNAFYKCTALEKLELGAVKHIGEYAFLGCTALKNIVFPSSIESIGKQAFRGCTGLNGLVLPCSNAIIDSHAFYGCKDLTLYVSVTEKPESWSDMWNSSYRPVVWGCTLSEDGAYLVSFEKTDGNITNKNTSNELSSPVKEGYTFGGWALDAESTVPDYNTENIMELSEGTVLYAIWLPENNQ